MEQSPFLVKICQLEQDYQTLEDCLRACTYDRTVQALMEETLPEDLHSEGTTPGEDRTEARMLCAEYAVDFARQAVRRAMLAVLSAAGEARQQEQDRETHKEESPQ